MARRATAFLRNADPGDLILLDLVLAELIFVMQRVYRQPRGAVALISRSTIGLRAVQCDSASLLHRSIELYEEGRHFTDAYLMATAEARRIPEIVSFDRGIRSTEKWRRVEP
jgi:predicted nucleic acid-binding protein